MTFVLLLLQLLQKNDIFNTVKDEKIRLTFFCEAVIYIYKEVILPNIHLFHILVEYLLVARYFGR